MVNKLHSGGTQFCDTKYLQKQAILIKFSCVTKLVDTQHRLDATHRYHGLNVWVNLYAPISVHKFSVTVKYAVSLACSVKVRDLDLYHLAFQAVLRGLFRVY